MSFAVLAFMFLFPVISLLVSSLSLKAFVSVLKEPYLYRIFFNTFRQSLLSVLLSLVVATICLLVICRGDFKGKNLFLTVSYLPFVLPSILVVLAFVLLFGRNSIFHINILYSLKAVVIAHAFYNFPIIMHPVYEAYMSMNREKEDVSYTLGGHPMRVFFFVTLRELRNTLLSSLLLVFIYTFSSFAIVLTLGGGIKNTTLEVEIYKNFKITLNKTLGTSYMLVSFLIMALMTLIYFVVSRKNKTDKTSRRRVLKKRGVLSSVFAFIGTFLVSLPVLRIIVYSFFPRSARGNMNFIKAYKNVFLHYNIIINSIVVAVLSGVMCVFMAFVISEYAHRRNKSFISSIIFLPLSVSGVALAEGWRTTAGGGWVSSLLILSLVHTFLSFPLVYKYIDSAVAKIPLSVRNVSLTLGACETYGVFRVDAPLLKAPLLKSFALSIALSLGEVSSALIVSGSSFTTLSGAIYSYISRYDYASASATAVVLMILSSFVVYFVHKREK